MRNLTNPTVLVPKKGSHSEVWNSLEFRQDDESRNHVHCEQCSADVSAQQGNTTNLYNHLKRHHRLQYNKAVKAKKKDLNSKQENHDCHFMVNRVALLHTSQVRVVIFQSLMLFSLS